MAQDGAQHCLMEFSCPCCEVLSKMVIPVVSPGGVCSCSSCLPRASASWKPTSPFSQPVLSFLLSMKLNSGQSSSTYIHLVFHHMSMQWCVQMRTWPRWIENLSSPRRRVGLSTICGPNSEGLSPWRSKEGCLFINSGFRNGLKSFLYHIFWHLPGKNCPSASFRGPARTMLFSPGELDCWDRVPRCPRRASRAPEVHTCGNAICVKLSEAGEVPYFETQRIWLI